MPRCASSGKRPASRAQPISDDEIDPLTPRNGQPAEFDAWRWERLDRVPDVVVPFRRHVYSAVAQQFAPFAN
jgi:putative (di)nucleoside polyphosphate hydrolase